MGILKIKFPGFCTLVQQENQNAYNILRNIPTDLQATFREKAEQRYEKSKARLAALTTTESTSILDGEISLYKEITEAINQHTKECQKKEDQILSSIDL